MRPRPLLFVPFKGDGRVEAGEGIAWLATVVIRKSEEGLEQIDQFADVVGWGGEEDVL